MPIKYLLKIALFGCAATCVTWAVRQHRSAADAHTELLRLKKFHAGMDAQIERISAPARLPEMAADLAEIKTPARSRTITADQNENRTIATETTCQPMDLIGSDPILQNLYLSSERANLAGRYAAFFRRLHLTAAQIESVEVLIARRNEQRMDIDDVVRTNHLDEADPSVVKFREKAAKSFHSDFVGLLGQSAYQAFTTYERALPTWEMVNRFAGVVALEGQPLTEPQATQLVDELANASPPFREGGVADTNQIDWPVVVTVTEKILTKPQKIAFLNMAPRYPVDDKPAIPTSTEQTYPLE